MRLGDAVSHSRSFMFGHRWQNAAGAGSSSPANGTVADTAAVMATPRADESLAVSPVSVLTLTPLNVTDNTTRSSIVDGEDDEDEDESQHVVGLETLNSVNALDFGVDGSSAASAQTGSSRGANSTRASSDAGAGNTPSEAGIGMRVPGSTGARVALPHTLLSLSPSTPLSGTPLRHPNSGRVRRATGPCEARVSRCHRSLSLMVSRT